MELSEGGLGNEDAVFPCAFCKAPTGHNAEVTWDEGWIDSAVIDALGNPASGQLHVRHFLYRCRVCTHVTYIKVTVDAKIPGRMVSEDEMKVRLRHRHPAILGGVSNDDSLPPDVRLAAEEAERCLAASAPHATGAMARRAVHALCANKQAEGHDLYTQLAWLKDNHVITPDLWEWAEELRTAGKVGAHPEWEDLTPEDAEYAVRFLRELLRYVYINPAERAARKMKETAVKKRSESDAGTEE